MSYGIYSRHACTTCNERIGWTRGRNQKKCNDCLDKLTEPRPCADCGETMQTPSAVQTKCPACRRKSRGDAMRLVQPMGIRRGPDNNMFKDGWTTFKKIPRERCERCGSTRFLCRHHKDRNRRNPSPDNIEILCKRCHQIEHDSPRIASEAARAKRLTKRTAA